MSGASSQVPAVGRWEEVLMVLLDVAGDDRVDPELKDLTSIERFNGHGRDALDGVLDGSVEALPVSTAGHEAARGA
jgi:hypothetical protein